jgi:pimeloyl-ACP methyl ester carboxylesterase
MTEAPRERFISARDGLQLFFRDWGDAHANAVPLLCLPGLTRSSRDFEAVARRQSARRRVICPDMRGRGRSAYASDWRTYEPRVYLDDIRNLLAGLGIGHVVVLGTSLGGLLGMALATAMPTSLAGLILNDVGPQVETTGLGRIMSYIGIDRPEPDWPSAANALRERFKSLSFRTDDQWIEFARTTYREGPDGKLHFDWDIALAKPLQRPSAPPPDLWALWRAVGPRPALAIRGGVSDILTEATLGRMKAEKSDLMHMTVPDVGHVPSLAEPGVPEAIDEFLARF